MTAGGKLAQLLAVLAAVCAVYLGRWVSQDFPGSDCLTGLPITVIVNS